MKIYVLIMLCIGLTKALATFIKSHEQKKELDDRISNFVSGFIVCSAFVLAIIFQSMSL